MQSSDCGTEKVVVEAMVTGIQQPTVRSVPAYASSRGQEAIELAASAGLVLDEWQKLVLVDALGVRDDGRWSSFEVGVNVSRQNGKGGILEARELAGLFLFGERLLLHSAHEFPTSAEAMLRMEQLLEGSEDLSRQVKTVSRSHGSEGFVLHSGARLRYRTRTKGGGRGFSGDCLILDEAMILPEPVVAALVPTLSGRSVAGDPQIWYAGNAVDRSVHEHGVVFARVRERGAGGTDPRLAYFEWSAIGPSLEEAVGRGELLADRALWAQANPALGARISEEHVEAELRAMQPRTFAVERLGIGDWPPTDGDAAGTVLDMGVWDALSDPHSTLEGQPVFAFDVTPDRYASSIAAAGPRTDGLAHGEIIEHRKGTGWLVPRLVELAGRHEPRAILCDGSGPAGSLLRDLEQAGLEVTVVSSKEHAQACGHVFDLVAEERLRYRAGPSLRAAVAGAAKRRLGDAWAWSRVSSSVDISPLVAVTLALWGASAGEPPDEEMPMVAFV